MADRQSPERVVEMGFDIPSGSVNKEMQEAVKAYLMEAGDETPEGDYPETIRVWVQVGRMEGGPQEIIKETVTLPGRYRAVAVQSITEGGARHPETPQLEFEFRPLPF